MIDDIKNASFKLPHVKYVSILQEFRINSYDRKILEKMIIEDLERLKRKNVLIARAKEKYPYESNRELRKNETKSND